MLVMKLSLVSAGSIPRPLGRKLTESRRIEKRS